MGLDLKVCFKEKKKKRKVRVGHEPVFTSTGRHLLPSATLKSRDLSLAAEADLETDHHRNVKIYFAIILLLHHFMYKDLFVNIWPCKRRRSATRNDVFPTNSHR